MPGGSPLGESIEGRMTETKHSKEPWVVDGSSDENLWIESHDGRHHKGAKQVCALEPGVSCATEEFLPKQEREANAQLIAAAPNLLAACKVAKEDIESFGGSYSTFLLLETVIANAERETP